MYKVVRPREVPNSRITAGWAISTILNKRMAELSGLTACAKMLEILLLDPLLTEDPAPKSFILNFLCCFEF
jgi:hypothetical protein